jgi:hypothetical protein
LGTAGFPTNPVGLLGARELLTLAFGAPYADPEGPKGRALYEFLTKSQLIVISFRPVDEEAALAPHHLLVDRIAFIK